MVGVLELVLLGLRLIVFALALALTLFSFQTYTEKQTERLQSVFIGFSFISMAVAVSFLSAQVETAYVTLFQIAETVPYIIGFGMLVFSLYR